MAVTTTRTLPAQFIEDLGKDYAKQLTATTAIPVDTSKFAPQVAAQDALQTQAATLAGSGVGSFQPFIQTAQTQAALASGLGTAALGQLGGVGTGAAAFQQDVPDFARQDATPSCKQLWREPFRSLPG